MATKVPLALLSGLLCDRGIWEPQIAALAGFADYSRAGFFAARHHRGHGPRGFSAGSGRVRRRRTFDGGTRCTRNPSPGAREGEWRGIVEHGIYTTSPRRRAAEASPVGPGAQRGFGCIGVTLDSTSPVGHESSPRRSAAGLSRNRSPIERDDIREPYTSIAREAGCIRSTAADSLSHVGRLRTAGRAERTRGARAHEVRHP